MSVKVCEVSRNFIQPFHTIDYQNKSTSMPDIITVKFLLLSRMNKLVRAATLSKRFCLPCQYVLTPERLLLLRSLFFSFIVDIISIMAWCIGQQTGSLKNSFPADFNKNSSLPCVKNEANFNVDSTLCFCTASQL